MEEIDIQFNSWWNREQPLSKIKEAVGRTRLTSDEARRLKVVLQENFVQAYGIGFGQHAAQYKED